MLAMTSVIVGKSVFIYFLTFYILQVASPNIVGPRVTSLSASISTGLGVLITH